MGSVGGATLASRVPAQTLRKVFAGFVLVMAGYVIWREAGIIPAVAVVTCAVGILFFLLLRSKGSVSDTLE